MNICFVLSQVSSRSENILKFLNILSLVELCSEKLLTILIKNTLLSMVPQRISGPESFIANVAGDDNSLQMICFNVVFYSAAHAFFSTHFANVCFLVSICIIVLAFPHH